MNRFQRMTLLYKFAKAIKQAINENSKDGIIETSKAEAVIDILFKEFNKP